MAQGHTGEATVKGRRQRTQTLWGRATVVERLSVAQRAGEKRFSTVVELLETSKGEQLVRFAYTTGDRARRGPVTLRTRDLERFAHALERTPALAERLGRLLPAEGGGAGAGRGSF